MVKYSMSKKSWPILFSKLLCKCVKTSWKECSKKNNRYKICQFWIHESSPSSMERSDISPIIQPLLWKAPVDNWNPFLKFHIRKAGRLRFVDDDAVSGLVHVVIQTKVRGNPAQKKCECMTYVCTVCPVVVTHFI